MIYIEVDKLTNSFPDKLEDWEENIRNSEEDLS
jgi:hypothetical protein